MEVRASEKGLPLVIEFDGQIPETIETDPMRLRQILFNLVGNAIKFTDEGSVRLVTRFCPHPTDPLLQFDVIDTGMGITPGQQAKIFAVFTQGDTSVTRAHGGSGLGLTDQWPLSETMLGGEIHVVSVPGRREHV